MNLHLRGQYTDVERGQRLAFTWKWDHEVRQPRSVMITFEPSADGTIITVQHMPYGATEQQERQLHAEAWQFFLEQLQNLMLSPDKETERDS